jgi:protein Mpv17
MLVKSLTSLFGFGVADVVAQGLSTSTNADARSSPKFDGARTLRFAAFGFFFYGPTSSVWYSSLDTYILPENPTSGLAVASKVFADQVLWAPVLISSLFAFDLAFDTSGRTKPTLSKKIENDLFSALKVNWSFWPMFHLFSFRFVPSEDRILYINCVQVLFNVFLVYTSSKREEGKGDEDSI